MAQLFHSLELFNEDQTTQMICSCVLWAVVLILNRNQVII